MMVLRRGAWRFVVAGLVAVLAALVPASLAQADTHRTVVFVLDTSGSMRGEKIDAAKKAVLALRASIPGDVAVGLVTFASTPVLTVAPTIDRRAFALGLSEVEVAGNTAMYDAILLARTAAVSADQGAVILVGDGEDTASRQRIGDVRVADWSTIQLSIVGVDFAAFDVVSAQFQNVVKESGGLLISVKETNRLVEALRLSLEQTGIYPVREPRPEPVPVPELLDQPLQVQDTTEHVVFGVVAAGSFFISTMLVSMGIRRSRYDRARKGMLGNFTRTRAVAQSRAIPIPQFLLDRNTWLPRALDGAGLTITPVAYRWRQLALWFGLFVLILLFGLPALLALVGSIALSAWLPRRYLLRLRTKRQKSFQSELPDFLSITASALRAGLPISQAIESSSRESTGELGRQMTRALQEMALGSSLDVSLRNVAERLESEDFAWLVTAIEVQRRVGGNLSDILDVAAETVRARLELQQEITTLAAEGLLSAKVLTALPVGLFLFLVVTRRDFVAPLWETPTGLLIFGFAGALMFAGYQWIRRLSRLEV